MSARSAKRTRKIRDARRKDYDGLGATERAGRHRPGSLNRKKTRSVKK